MAKRTDAATIGAFVVGAMVLFVVAIVIWGSGRFFRKTVDFICYFDDSVDGLTVGAPVKARGVVIGKVSRIRLRYRQRPTDPRIPVFIQLDIGRLAEFGVPLLPTQQDYDALIARGLRARLESQNLVTRSLFVNLWLFPGTPAIKSQVDTAGGYPEIPTVPKELSEVGKSATALLGNLEAVDFVGLASAISKAASSVERLVEQGSLPRAIAQVHTTMESYDRLEARLEAGLPPLIAQLQATTDDVRKTLVGLDGATAAAGQLIAPQAALSVRLNEGLVDFGRAANAVRDLAEYLRRNPNALIVGKPR